MDLNPNDTGLDDSDKNLGPARVGEELQNLLTRLEEEFRQLSASRDEIGKRITAVKRTVHGLNALFGAEVQERSQRRYRSAGLTKLCRQFLGNHGTPMTVVELIDRIREQYPETLSRHKHPRNSVMVILKRLVDYGEIIEVKNGRGLRAWVVTRESNSSATSSGQLD